MNIVMTKSTMFLVKYVAEILGVLMEFIYGALDKVGIPNVGLAIILFTVIMYILMIPLTVKQQKFTKMNAIMAPELNKIRDKYKNRKDQESIEKMNAETNAVYEKYGVSPTGSCVQLLIQMPVLFALYQVIYKIPGYIGAIADIFTELMEKIVAVDGYSEIIKTFVTENKISTLQLITDEATGLLDKRSVVDFLYKLTPGQWSALAQTKEFSGMGDLIASTSDNLAKVNNFLGMNISDNPMSLATASFKAGAWGMVIAAALIPLLAYATQVLNMKLMPQPNMDGNDTASTTMKSMNTVMPLMSLFFCATLPVGIGIYWIVGAVVRTAIQIGINRSLNKMDMDELMAKNMEAARKKAEKKKETSSGQIQANVQRNTKRISTAARNVSTADVDTTRTDYKPGSIAEKANRVRILDEQKKKK